MGNESSSEASSPVTGPPANSRHHGVELRNNTLSKARQPTDLKQMPNREELDKRYTTVLMSMDLPPDKMKLLKNYDDDKKWELIRDQDLVTAKNPPSYYLDKLRVYLDPKGTKHKKKQMLGDETSTQTLRDLEISLRTNQVQWVREFLSDENKGLDVLVKYLFESQAAMREELMSTSTESDMTQNTSASMTRKSSHPNTASISKAKSHRLKPSSSKLNFGDATDDVHVCIMCLRAIMNHQYGFNLVFAHKEAINCIALSLNHNSMRTKTLVLELLAAVCLVRGGHQITLTAFDNFKEVCSERRRFETLMHYFRSPEEFHIDFMVACMQFINIVVHSVENVNFRVHLQHEFSLLGLDDYLEELRQTESDVLSIQVRAYIDNLIDVASLLEDSDTKTDALERVAELEENLSWEKERAQAAEREASAQIAALRNELEETRSELENYKALCGQQEEQLRYLEKNLKEKETETLKRQSMLEDKLKELEDLRKNLQNTTVLSPRSPKTPQSAEVSVAPPMPPPPPPPPPPPAPPAPSMPPPGPPPLPGSTTSALHIKKALQPKHRLPVLNWVAMKPQEVKGTVFAELDDEKLYEVIDFDQFEALFKLGDALLNTDESTPKSLRKAAKHETISLLETNRLRNVAITRRKIECSEEEMVRAINSLNLKSLSLERVEILMRIVPNDQEIKAFKEYEKEKKPLSALSEEDRFMMTLWKIERLSQKLNIMSFIGNFFDIRNTLVPQLQAVIAASRSIRNSEKVRKMLEIILAFGNYMNSSKRGAVYGFKLQSLDMLLDTKTSDKKLTLLHYIVQTVQQKFPEIQNFENELNFLEKASTVSLENILSYIQELDKGMEATRREYNLRKENERPPILQEFLSKAEDMTKDLKADIKSAQEAYKSAVEYFGENPKTLAPNTFFSLFVRFVRSYRQAIIDLDNMRKAEINQIVTRASIREKKASNRQTQQDLLIELKKMQRAVRDKKVMNPDDLYHGALDDILLDMKSAPYRRADAVRKSQRRRIERQISEVESEHL